MANPATGAAMILGLRPELIYNEPDPTASFIYHHPDPPVGMDLLRTLGQSPEINPSGYQQPGVPGAITGPLDLAIMLQASTILEPLENVLGGDTALAQETLEAGVYRYTGTPRRVNDTSFSAVVALPPVGYFRANGIKFASITIPVGNNNPNPARLAGFISHGTRLSHVTQTAGTGTYTEGPDVRGNFKRPRVGEKLFVKATRAVAGGGLQYKAERVPSAGTATYPGVAIDAVYDAAGRGIYDPLVVAYQITGTVSVGAGGTAVTGVATKFLDELEVGDYITIAGENKIITAITTQLAMAIAAHTAGASGVVAHKLLDEAGWWTENRDPVELIFPATTTEQGDIALNDIWSWDVAITSPSPTYLSGQRYTSAHAVLEYRRQGAATWLPLNPLTGQFVIPNQLTIGQGWGSRYYQSLDRDGVLGPTLQITRKFTDTALQQLADSHELFEIRHRWLGQRLGTGTYRESIQLTGLAAQIVSYAKPVSGPQAVIETINIDFNGSAAGDPPLTPVIITDRNYTVAA